MALLEMTVDGPPATAIDVAVADPIGRGGRRGKRDTRTVQIDPDSRVWYRNGQRVADDAALRALSGETNKYASVIAAAERIWNDHDLPPQDAFIAVEIAAERYDFPGAGDRVLGPERWNEGWLAYSISAQGARLVLAQADHQSDELKRGSRVWLARQAVVADDRVATQLAASRLTLGERHSSFTVPRSGPAGAKVAFGRAGKFVHSIRELVAANPHCHPDVLQQMARSQSMDVLRGVAANPQFPDSQVQRLITKHSWLAETVASERPTIDEGTVRYLVTQEWALPELAARPDLPGDVYEHLAGIDDPRVQSGVVGTACADDANVPDSVYEHLAAGATSHRVQIAGSASTPAHVLAILASDPHVDVSTAAARNPNCPAATSAPTDLDRERWARSQEEPEALLSLIDVTNDLGVLARAIDDVKADASHELLARLVGRAERGRLPLSLLWDLVDAATAATALPRAPGYGHDVARDYADRALRVLWQHRDELGLRPQQ